MKILVTGSAGFIGSSLINKLQAFTDWEIFGIDNYRSRSEEEVKLKSYRTDNLLKGFGSNWVLEMLNKKGLHQYLDFQKFDLIIHLAAMAGVRESLKHPEQYFDNNVQSFLNLLEFAKENKTPIIYASSSSVYGNTYNHVESVTADIQLNPYALSKLFCEQLASTYNYLYEIPLVGLRLFTVYGPYGRPDMVYYKWTDAILNDEPINLFSNGWRDFTYIDSVTDAITHIIKKKDFMIENKVCNIYNIGNGNPFYVPDLIKLIENETGKKAKVISRESSLAEANRTHSNSGTFERAFNYDLSYPIEEGMREFINWFIDYKQKTK